MMLWEFPSIAGYGSGMATAAACTIATAQVPSLAMGPSNDMGVTKKKKKMMLWCTIIIFVNICIMYIYICICIIK